MYHPADVQVGQIAGNGSPVGSFVSAYIQCIVATEVYNVCIVFIGGNTCCRTG